MKVREIMNIIVVRYAWLHIGYKLQKLIIFSFPISSKNEFDFRIDRRKIQQKCVFFNYFFTVHQTEKIPQDLI